MNAAFGMCCISSINQPIKQQSISYCTASFSRHGKTLALTLVY